jgi:ATP synthase F1 gamma subunit
MMPRVATARGFASEKEMRDRIAATGNIAKITKSMKMVSAARMKYDEQKMMEGAAFGSIFARTMQPPTETEGDGESSTAASDGTKQHMVICNSADRGLCGGINSQVSKAARLFVDELKNQGHSVKLVTIGDKGRGQLGRTHRDDMVYSVDQHTKSPITFGTCGGFAARLVDMDYDECTIVYNHYVSMIAYEQRKMHLKNMTPPAEAEAGYDATPAHLFDYEFEPEDKAEALMNLAEFAMAGSLYGAIIDGNAAEQSARMSAMENASKNAEEMIEKFTLAYNRIRQARITTELIEIISGASALETGED